MQEMNIVSTSQIRERGNRRDHQAGDMAELMVLNIPSVSGGANAWGWTRGIGVKNADVRVSLVGVSCIVTTVSEV